jgi:hypothetical protein
MSLDRKYEECLDLQMERLRIAAALTPDLIFDVIADVCTRFLVLKHAGNAANFDRFIEAGAWTDAALALIELELPAWRLRRLIYENGAWFCSLSKDLNLPLELDDTADARHDVLALAILSAFVTARRESGVPPASARRASSRFGRHCLPWSIATILPERA